MWKLDHRESWVLKNWCFWTVEKTLESPLDSKKIIPANLCHPTDYSMPCLPVPHCLLELASEVAKSQIQLSDWTATATIILPTRLVIPFWQQYHHLWLYSRVCALISPPFGLQHARPSCPSPSPRVCPSSCPLSRWCYPTISSHNSCSVEPNA